MVPYRCDSQETYRAESKKPAVRRVLLNGTWQCPTLTWGNPTLPSALIRFTSEFGMESGGTVSLWLPGKTDNNLGKIILIQSVSNYFLLYLSCKIMIAFYHDFCARRTNSTYCCLSHPIDLLIICLQRQLLTEAF